MIKGVTSIDRTKLFATRIDHYLKSQFRKTTNSTFEFVNGSFVIIR